MDYKFATQILIVLLYVPTLAAVYSFFVWRGLVEASWKRAAFTIVPLMLLGFMGVRIMAQLGLFPTDPQILFIVAALYVFNNYLMVSLLLLATRTVKQADLAFQKSLPKTEGMGTSDLLAAVEQKTLRLQARCQRFSDGFLKT